MGSGDRYADLYFDFYVRRDGGIMTTLAADRDVWVPEFDLPDLDYLPETTRAQLVRL